MKILSLFLFVLIAFEQSRAAIQCSILSQNTKTSTQRIASENIDKDYDITTMGGVMVTGEMHYSLPKVLSHLGLENSTLSKYRGKTVVSVAEGFSGLLPHLLRAGTDAWGVDLIYGIKEIPQSFYSDQIENYFRQYGERLITGDAIQLPFLDSSVDLLLSHKLVNNISRIQTLLFARDAVRVLKKGAEARIFGFDFQLVEETQMSLRKKYGSSIRMSTESHVIQYQENRKPAQFTMYLLTIKKMR